jgi:hypothetical protein
MSNNRGHSRIRYGPNATYSSSSIISMTRLVTVNRCSIIAMSNCYSFTSLVLIFYMYSIVSVFYNKTLLVVTGVSSSLATIPRIFCLPSWSTNDPVLAGTN